MKFPLVGSSLILNKSQHPLSGLVMVHKSLYHLQLLVIMLMITPCMLVQLHPKLCKLWRSLVKDQKFF